MLPTHKEGVVYLEHCKISVADDRLSYSREDDAGIKHWSIPYAATGCLLLGPGTSLTQQAARLLGNQGVMVGFVGGDGSPLFFASQSEYRPTRYLQGWAEFWFDPAARLAVARYLLARRASYAIAAYGRLGIPTDKAAAAANSLCEQIQRATTTEAMLGLEAVFAKAMYATVAESVGADFRRQPRGADTVNRFLDHGNYLSYGLAATTLWVLGIPHAMPVLHGQTRRGALVFDLADVVKDACILPAAFAAAADGVDNAQNRARCTGALEQFKAFETMFATMKEAIDVGCGDR